VSVKHVPGDPPFVIDRALPGGLFDRAPGVREYVAGVEGDALEFATADEAEEFLRKSVTGEDGLDYYDWTIEPKEAP
jgi:hypothetical protein